MADSRELKIVVSGDASGGKRALQEIGQEAGKTGTALATTGEGFGGIAAGLGTATAAIGVFAAAVGAAVAVVAGLFAAASKAVTMAADWGNAIDGIQDVTGFTAEFASTLAHVGEIAGVSTDQIAQMMSANARIFREASEQAAKIRRQEIADRAEALQKQQDEQRKHQEKITQIIEDSSERIIDLQEKRTRIDEDYNRDAEEASRKLNESLADITAARNEAIADSQKKSAEKIKQLNDDLAEQQLDYTEQQQKLQDKVNEAIERGKERLANQESNYADRIRNIEQSVTDARMDAVDKREVRELDNKRELERFEKEYAAKRADLESQIAAATDDKDKATLQKKLDALAKETIERRQALQDQFTEAQIKADEDLALRAKQAERRKAQEAEENQRRIAEIQAQNERERVEAQAKADAELAKLKADNDEKVAELWRRITTENAQLAEQTTEINAEADKRMGRLKGDYDRARAEVKLRYDREVADNKEAQDKITIDRQKRLMAEIADYNRVTELIKNNLEAQLQKSQEVMPPVIKAIQDLGLKWEDIEKLKPDERMQLILGKLALMPDSANKAALEMSLFGKSGKDLNDIAEIYASKTLPDWMEKTKTANKLLSEDGVKAAVDFSRKQNEIKAEFEGLVGQIGRDLMPAFQKFLDKLQEFWQKHGPEITKFINNLIEKGLPGMLGLIENLFKALEYVGNTTVFKWMTGSASNTDMLQSAGNAATTATANPLIMSLINQLFPGLGLVTNGLAIANGAGYLGSPSGGATAGGTPIGGGTNNYTINVQNPITNNSDIPSMVQYLQLANGGSN